MATKPTLKPLWTVTQATNLDNDVNNPESGQPNVSEPPLANKELGWDFKQFPPRQWLNWLGRIYYRWIDWFDQEVDAVKARGVVFDQDVKITTTYLTVETTGTLKCAIQKLNATGTVRLVTIKFPIGFYGTSNSGNLSISPDTSWDARLLPVTNPIIVPMVFENDSKSRPGRIVIFPETSTPWQCQIYDASLEDINENYFASSNAKGVDQAQLTYGITD